MRAPFRKLTDAIRGVILYQLNHQRDNFMEEQEQSPVQNVKHMHGALKKRITKAIFIGVLKNNIVLLIAVVAAAVTCVFVPFDDQYTGYFDLGTLTCLFCTLAVVAAFKNIKFFEWLANVIIRRFKTKRNLALALVFITYFGSMIMANDMALITFLPLGFFALSMCGERKLTALTFVMQNVAANLGGMLTPFGNPQNLYLYSFFSIPAAEFFKIMALPFAVAFVLILSVCLFVKPTPIELRSAPEKRPAVWRMIVYSVLFALSILIVFRVFDYYWGLIAVTLSLIVFDYKSLLRVDYSLLLTFCAFFIFSGNMARIDAVRDFFSKLISEDALLFSVLSCQLISNVPSAVLLSKFTQDYAGLLIAVNIGGLGTPIASLASLITLRSFNAVQPENIKKYIGIFLLINFGFLAVLLGTGYAALAIIG